MRPVVATLLAGHRRVEQATYALQTITQPAEMTVSFCAPYFAVTIIRLLLTTMCGCRCLVRLQATYDALNHGGYPF